MTNFNKTTSFKRWIINRLIKIFPPTRFYEIKRKLLILGDIKIGDNCKIVSSARFIGNGPIKIGCKTFIGHEVLIIASNKAVKIGDNVDIAPRVLIANGTHEIDIYGERSAGQGLSKRITIGNGVWIGAGTIIISGVNIGEKSVIGAGSVVNKDIPNFSVATGNPCRVIRRIIE